MILSVHQPNYWPYPGLIGKIMKSDVFLYLTKVQFEKNSWQKRNRLRTKEGWSYIQAPVIRGSLEQQICDVLIDNRKNWKDKHLKMITMLYQRCPFFQEYEPFLTDTYQREWEYLAELDIHIMNFILQELHSKTKILYDRDFSFEGHKTDLLVDICRKTGCDTYISNLGSQAYVELSAFINNNLNHLYIDYTGEAYPQRFPGFEPGLSILDMLMNCGRDKTREILLKEENYRMSAINQLIAEDAE